MEMMYARPETDRPRFRDLLRAVVRSREARNDIILGIAERLVARPDAYESTLTWVAVDGDVAVGAAVVTPPWRLVIADEAATGAAAALAEGMMAAGLEVPGVVGNRPAADHFAATWADLAGRHLELVMAQGVFALEEVRPVRHADGTARPAGRPDRDLLTEWIGEFLTEAFPIRPPGAPGDIVEAALAADDGGFWIWESSGTPVSASGYGRPTPLGIRVGPVYTPPQHRGRGYATSLVAAQSAWLIERGHRYCFLTTDLANATSNDIYERIGYEQVAESADYRFVD
jgi:GNAT superfamily N-acetyltransferase